MSSSPAFTRLVTRLQLGVRRHRHNVRAASSSPPRKLAERNVIDELDSRGFISAVTNPSLREHVTAPRCLYSGVDPSASSLHVGNLLPLMGLLHFRTAGHRAIAIRPSQPGLTEQIGGATGSIGDPSGRSTERNALAQEELEKNVKGITEQVERFFTLGGEYTARRGGYAAFGRHGYRDKGKGKERAVEDGQGAEEAVEALREGLVVLNNLDWTQGVGLLEFLRTVGKMARVNVMLARDSVKNRLSSEQGISYTEFTYQLLQAADFLHLYRHHGCTIQLGGSDQWGNIIAGIDLIKRMAPDLQGEASEAGRGLVGEGGLSGGQQEPAFGLTIPLLTTSSGEKFGKSAGNAVWLDAARTSVSDFYQLISQFFLRSSDEDVERYLRIFSWLPVPEIEDLIEEHDRDRKGRMAQRILADEVTELVHGGNAVRRARTAAHVLFRAVPSELKADEILSAFEGDGRLRRVKWSDIKGVPVSKLAVQYGLVQARADANRLIRSGSMYVNDRRVNDPRYLIVRQEMVQHRVAIIRTGTKHHLILHVDD